MQLGSNIQPLAFEADAVPLSYQVLLMVISTIFLAMLIIFRDSSMDLVLLPSTVIFMGILMIAFTSLCYCFGLLNVTPHDK